MTKHIDLYTHVPPKSAWRKSTHSAGEGQCVEVATLPGNGQAVRDSKDRGIPPLRFTAAQWSAFRAGVLSGAF
ncbi:DUF397 domain-containing protein [Streptomyces sp. NPDC054863]